jgi:hypothetical protein
MTAEANLQKMRRLRNRMEVILISNGFGKSVEDEGK